MGETNAYAHARVTGIASLSGFKPKLVESRMATGSKMLAVAEVRINSIIMLTTAQSETTRHTRLGR